MLLDSVSKNYVYKGISLRLENREAFKIQAVTMEPIK